MSILHAFVSLFIQILAITFGYMLLEKQENGKIKFLLEVCVGSVMTDGCVVSFFVTYWFFLENVADRINIVNDLLRLKFHNHKSFRTYP